MSEPIEDGGELNGAEKSNGDFVIAGGNTAEAFDATEEVLDAVVSAVVALMKRSALAAAPTRGNAGARFFAVEERPKSGCIESLVCHRALAPQGRYDRQDCLEIRPLSWRQAQSNRSTIGINDGCELGVDASLGPIDFMLRSSTPGLAPCWWTLM